VNMKSLQVLNLDANDIGDLGVIEIVLPSNILF